MTPKKKFDPDPQNPVQARQCIAAGLSWFFAHKPLAMWPLLAVLIGSNGTAWYKALFDDTVTIKPVGQVSASVMPQAIAGEDPFREDSAWTVKKWQGRYVLRIKNPSGRMFDVEFPAMEKMR